MCYAKTSEPKTNGRQNVTCHMRIDWHTLLVPTIMNSTLKKALIFVLVMGVLATAGWLGRKQYRKWNVHRLVVEGRQYLEKKDFRNVNLCLKKAMQSYPWSLEANLLVADTMDAIGSPSALEARARVVQLAPDVDEYRYALAQTALRAQNFRVAAEALTSLSAKATNTATFHKLAGALEWELRHQAEAEKHYSEALRLEPTNGIVIVNLATVRLASKDTNIANAARVMLENMSANPVVEVTALRHLTADAVSQKQMTKAMFFGARLARDPQATIGDKIDYLDLLRVCDSAEFSPYLARMKEAAKKSVGEAYALGRWMAVTDNSTNALRWLQSLPAEVRTNQPTPLIITDCLVANKDWKSLLAFVEKDDWGEVEYYRVALTALAQKSLAQKLAFENAWRKTLRLASHRLDRLTRVAQTTGAWGWTAERTEVLREIAATFPKARWALEELISQYYKTGDTRSIQEVLIKSQALDPSDARLKNNLANVYLLRKMELPKAHLMAKQAYDAGTNDPFFITTYAYSLLVQNKRPEAVKVFEGIKPEYLKIPAVAAYYGVVQAFGGHKDAAKEPLALAESSPLLPEEKELVKLAKAKL